MCDTIFITPDSASWDPYSDHFGKNETAMVDHNGELLTHVNYIQKELISDETNYSVLPSVSTIDATIDQVINTTMDNVELNNDSTALADEEGLLNELFHNALMTKINSSLGTMSLNPQDCDEDPLFKTTMEDIEMTFESDLNPSFSSETTFESEIYTIEGYNTTGVKSDYLKKIWSITENEAQSAIERNTQLNRQSTEGSLFRLFYTNDRMLRYRRIKIKIYTGTMLVTKSAKSTRGNLYLQVFVSDKDFVAVYSMELKSDFKDTLHLFCKKVGVPIDIVVDPSGEQTSKHVRKFCNQVGTTLRILEESTQWANRADLYIGLLKKAICKDLLNSDSPMILWDYCAQRRALIHNLTPRDLFQTEKQSPYEYQYGVQGDISNLCAFAWYDWCYYHEEGNNTFPKQK